MMQRKRREAWDAYCAADKAWQEALNAQFGRDASMARYEKRGRGEPGSQLRDLYEAKERVRSLTSLLGHPARTYSGQSR